MFYYKLFEFAGIIKENYGFDYKSFDHKSFIKLSFCYKWRIKLLTRNVETFINVLLAVILLKKILKITNISSCTYFSEKSNNDLTKTYAHGICLKRKVFRHLVFHILPIIRAII